MTDALEALVSGLIEPEQGSAAVLLAARSGRVTRAIALGATRSWDAPGVPAPAPRPVDLDTRFDLASITKAFTAAALLAELDRLGRDPSFLLADALPEFREPRYRALTVAHLLSHTAGFPAEWHDRDPDPDAARFRATSRPVLPPGTVHRYSCVGFIWAGILAAELAGEPLDSLVARRVLDPLGLADTGYRPAAAERTGIAATEYQPGRGLVQGVVHDETAFAFGGVSGNAGLFGTAPDLLRFAEALRRHETSSLGPRVTAWLTEPVTVPGGTTRPAGHFPTLGLRSDDVWMSALPARTVGHGGFTGTAFLTEPCGERSLVLLTNRVHPLRPSESSGRLWGPVIAGLLMSERGHQ